MGNPIEVGYLVKVTDISNVAVIYRIDGINFSQNQIHRYLSGTISIVSISEPSKRKTIQVYPNLVYYMEGGIYTLEFMEPDTKQEYVSPQLLQIQVPRPLETGLSSSGAIGTDQTISHIPPDEIWFYHEKDKELGIYSNFYPSKIVIGDKIYPTSEAYFQSEKFLGGNSTPASREYSEIISSQNTPGKAAILGRQMKPKTMYKWSKVLWEIIQQYQDKGVVIRDDFDEIKDNVMRRVVYQKFSQHPDLAVKLLSTGDKKFYEHTNRDSYWGDGHPVKNPNIHGDGRNKLGQIIEETRYLLGGEVSKRGSNIFDYDYANWVIPGYFLMSGILSKDKANDLKSRGFRHFISLMEEDEESKILVNSFNYRPLKSPENDFSIAKDSVVYSRWSIPDRKVSSDEKAVSIASVLLKAIGRSHPTVLHCYGGKGRTGTIACLVVGFLYGLNGDESISLVDRLFQTHRMNKGRRKAVIPQTAPQRAQIKRILSRTVNQREYSNFDFM
jgi:N-glycosidase YbiA